MCAPARRCGALGQIATRIWDNVADAGFAPPATAQRHRMKVGAFTSVSLLAAGMARWLSVAGEPCCHRAPKDGKIAPPPRESGEYRGSYGIA